MWKFIKTKMKNMSEKKRLFCNKMSGKQRTQLIAMPATVNQICKNAFYPQKLNAIAYMIHLTLYFIRFSTFLRSHFVYFILFQFWSCFSCKLLAMYQLVFGPRLVFHLLFTCILLLQNKYIFFHLIWIFSEKCKSLFMFLNI